MHFSITVLIAWAASARAFKDTSPFLLFSSSPLPKELADVSRNQLQSAASVLETTRLFLKDCPSELYYIVSQPSLSHEDLTQASSIPHLKHALKNSNVQSEFSVSEVVGLEDGSAKVLLEEIEAQCGGILGYDSVANGDWERSLRAGKKVLVYGAFDGLPLENGREKALAESDNIMYTDILKSLSKEYKYTVIYTSTPRTPSIQIDEDTYEPSFPNPAQIELKRGLNIRVPPGTVNNDSRPLFEKYQFFTPGLFMGLLVSLLLLAILSVGIAAVASLQVSYGAFDKEMGPAAQKK